MGNRKIVFISSSSYVRTSIRIAALSICALESMNAGKQITYPAKKICMRIDIQLCGVQSEICLHFALSLQFPS